MSIRAAFLGRFGASPSQSNSNSAARLTCDHSAEIHDCGTGSSALLAVDGVRIWCVPHVLSSCSQEALAPLTGADYAEFSSIRHLGARGRSLAARAALRRALSAAVDGDVAPQHWRFKRTARGKPVLDATNGPQVQFSCTHTHWASAIAVSADRRVGIDLESSMTSFEQPILASYFSDGERRAVGRLPQGQRNAAIARLWTLKEAYVKLVGTGLTEGVSQLAFGLEDDVASEPLRHENCGEPIKFKTWRLFSQGHRLSLALAMSA